MQFPTVVLACLAITFCARSADAVTIEQVLPFTPAVDAVRLHITLRGDGTAKRVELDAALRRAGSRETVWTGSLGTLALEGDGSVTLERNLEGLPVKPWSPGAPHLYELILTATDGGQQAAQSTVRFGFRTVESRNGNIYLNGRPIFLRGLAINPPGRSIPQAVGESREFARDYIAFLRAQHVNIIRLEHDNQHWFDVCDELGMMVYQGFYGSPPSGLTAEEEDLAGQDEAGRKRLPQDVDRSVAAYIERFETYVPHPSIVIYVLSNELPYKGEAGERVHEFLTRVHARLQEWDNTRLYIGNAGYGEGREGDINDVHRYWGWYYNTFLTYYNLRDPGLFGDPARMQPFTFSECVGNFTGPNGAYNCIERKQLAAQLCWTGTGPDQTALAQDYQAFMVREACESFRRMRALNPRISGIMPFTIAFRNWRGIQSFEQMEPTAAARQFGISYQPVLLSWENWQTQVYAGTTVRVVAHVINDADDFTDIENASLRYELRAADQQIVAQGQIPIPKVEYYGTWRAPVELELAPDLPTGEYVLHGKLERDGRRLSANTTQLFVAGPDWQSAPNSTVRRVVLYDPSGNTAAALHRIGIVADNVSGFDTLQADSDCLVIGQEAWDESLQGAQAQIRAFVKAGGRVLCLGQRRGQFDAGWLPSHVELCERSVNDPEYMTVTRPTYDQMHVNPQRPDHPAFAGVDRERLKLWSDDTHWDQTQPGFPRVYPVQYGFVLTNAEDLAHTAILADYDAGLQGTALCEMFDGGSVMLCALDVARPLGIDPVADRMLGNLVAYMADGTEHLVHPRVNEPIRWGDYATHQGVLSGPLQGLFLNTEWLPPPTAPSAHPSNKNSGWNTRPGDQFVPRGVRPRGSFYFTFNCVPRDRSKSDVGTGEFWATVPAGRTSLVSTIRNPLRKPAKVRVSVNESESDVEIGPGATIEIRTPIPGQTDLHVRYTGDRELVILESAFE